MPADDHILELDGQIIPITVEGELSDDHLMILAELLVDLREDRDDGEQTT